MKKAFWLAALACVWGCGGNQPGANTLNNSGTFKQPGNAAGNLNAVAALLKGAPAKVIAAGNEAGFRLFVEAAKGAEGNVLVSPVGVSSLVSLASNALETDGQVALHKALKYEGIKPQDVNAALKQLRDALPQADTSAEFRSANSIWTTEDIKLDKDLLSLNRKYYGAKLGPLSAKALKPINSWAQDSTGGRIKEILKEKEAEVPAALLNASGVAASLGLSTTDDEFSPAKGDAVKTQYLTGAGSFDYFKAESFEVVRVPLQGNRLNLYLLVPESNDGLKGAMGALNSMAWNKLTGELATKPVILTFPAIKDSFDFSLNPALEALAIPTTLKKISSKPVLVKQKSFIELSGASTASATAETDPAAIKVKADRPFVYVVEDTATKSLLLVGLYNKP
jgi:serpin B